MIRKVSLAHNLSVSSYLTLFASHSDLFHSPYFIHISIFMLDSPHARYVFYIFPFVLSHLAPISNLNIFRPIRSFQKMSFSSLPNELLPVIFAHLDVTERVRVRLVCHRFYQSALNSLNELTVTGSDGHSKLIHLLPIVSGQLKCLCLENVNLNCQVLLQTLLSSCFRLTTLNVNCQTVTASSWSQLVHRFGSQLHELHLRGSYLTAPNQMENILLQNLNPDLLRKLSFVCRTSEWLFTLCKQFNRLTHLDVTITTVPEFPILQVLPQLKALRVSIEKGFTSFDWLRKSVHQRFPLSASLKVLILEGELLVPYDHYETFSHLSSLRNLRLVLRHHDQLAPILQHLPDLKSLSIQFNLKVGGMPLKAINNLCHLDTLEIEWPSPSWKKLKFSSFKPMPSLRNFTFRALDCPYKSKYGEDLVKRLPYAFPNLQSLDMCTAHWISPYVFFRTAIRIPSLRALNMEVSSLDVDNAYDWLSYLFETRDGFFCANSCCDLPTI